MRLRGTGEVCGTAIETAMDVILRLSVRRDFSIEAPQFHVPAGAEVEDAQDELPRLHGRRARPDGVLARCRARAIAHPGYRYRAGAEEAYASRAWPPTCGSTKSSTRPTGSSGAFIPEAIFEEVDDDERRCPETER
jgi:hypothetical protein